MRTIIAGSRGITDMHALYKAIEYAEAVIGIVPTLVLSGRARGVDRMGEEWAEQHGIPIEYYPADWNLYGKARAGKIRNAQMSLVAHALIAVWNGYSPGTANMIELARKRGLKCAVWVKS